MEEYWKPDATEKLKNLEEMKNFGLHTFRDIYSGHYLEGKRGEKKKKEKCDKTYVKIPL